MNELILFLRLFIRQKRKINPCVSSVSQLRCVFEAIVIYRLDAFPGVHLTQYWLHSGEFLADVGQQIV